MSVSRWVDINRPHFVCPVRTFMSNNGLPGNLQDSSRFS